jgi:SAM-dependent methyltransferase
MSFGRMTEPAAPHHNAHRAPHGPGTPSEWVTRFAHLVPPDGSVLDLAAGRGRHARYFLERGYSVVALDRDVSRMADLAGRAEVIEADLEDGSPWPLGARRFDGVVVANYLYRPRFAAIRDAVAPGGVLLYETFGSGNEAYGKPRNPDHLLKPGELIELVRGALDVIAYECGLVERDAGPAVIQRICARKGGGGPARL